MAPVADPATLRSQPAAPRATVAAGPGRALPAAPPGALKALRQFGFFQAWGLAPVRRWAGTRAGRGSLAGVLFVAGWSSLWAHGLQLIAAPDWLGVAALVGGIALIPRGN